MTDAAKQILQNSMIDIGRASTVVENIMNILNLAVKTLDGNHRQQVESQRELLREAGNSLHLAFDKIDRAIHLGKDNRL